MAIGSFHFHRLTMAFEQQMVSSAGITEEVAMRPNIQTSIGNMPAVEFSVG